MLTRFGLSNFKSFSSDPQFINFRPITLLFGANSAGKSSLLRALLLTKAAFTGGTFDIYKTAVTGDTIDFGGIRNLLHKHNIGKNAKFIYDIISNDSKYSIEIEFGIEDDRFMEHGNRKTEMKQGIKRLLIRSDDELKFEATGHIFSPKDGEIWSDRIIYLNNDSIKKHSAFGSYLKSSIYPEYKRRALLNDHKPYVFKKFAEIIYGALRSFAFRESTFLITPDLINGRLFYRPKHIGDMWSISSESNKFFAGILGEHVECDRTLLLSFLNSGVSKDSDYLEDGFDSQEEMEDFQIHFFYESYSDKMADYFEFVDSKSGKNLRSSAGIDLDILSTSCQEAFDYVASLVSVPTMILRSDILKYNYIEPFRKIPQRFSTPHLWQSDSSDNPWKLLREPEVLKKINFWLRDKLSMGIEFVLDEFYNEAEVKEIARHSKRVSELTELSNMILEIHDQLSDSGLDGQLIKNILLDSSKKYLDHRKNKESWADTLMEFVDSLPGKKFIPQLIDHDDELERYEDDDVRFSIEINRYRLEEQFHITPSISEVKIKDIDSNVLLSPFDVGFGVSQIIPVIANSLGHKNQYISIEQPELHIHPKLQAEMGDMLIEACKNMNNTIIAETHSEHLILRILRRVRETYDKNHTDGVYRLKLEDINIYYIDKKSDCAVVNTIETDMNGDFVGHWPEGFFADRSKELF